MADLKRRLDEIMASAVDNTVDMLAGRRMMYAVSFGRKEIPPLSTVDFSLTTGVPFVLLDIGYKLSGWEDEPLPWRWRNKVARWLLRRVLRRRPPMRMSTPCLIELLTVGGDKWFGRPVFLQHVAVDVMASRPFSQDDAGHDPTMNVLIPAGVECLLRVTNISERPATLWLGMHGWRIMK